MKKETWVIMSNKDTKERMDKMDGYVGNYNGKINQLIDMYDELKKISESQNVPMGAVWNLMVSISKSLPNRFMQSPAKEEAAGANLNDLDTGNGKVPNEENVV